MPGNETPKPHCFQVNENDITEKGEGFYMRLLIIFYMNMNIQRVYTCKYEN